MFIITDKEEKDSMSNQNDAINPKHYNRLNPQPKDVIRAWGLNFNLGSAVKYISRAGHKDDIVQDLKKAQEFIQFEIDAIEDERKKEIVKKEQEMIHDKEPKCEFNPIFADMDNGKGVCVGTLEVTVPAGADPEDIIKTVIKKVYAGGR